MTQSPANNVVEVNPAPNIYTVLMIIAILAMVITICFAGNRLMSKTNPNGDWSVPGGYGLGVGEMFKPFEEQNPTPDSGRIGSGTSRASRARTRGTGR